MIHPSHLLETWPGIQADLRGQGWQCFVMAPE